jgi:hypothetical protein
MPAETILPERAPKRRMLVIVNPYATTVSDRLKNLVVHALRSRYSVDARPPGRATTSCSSSVATAP